MDALSPQDAIIFAVQVENLLGADIIPVMVENCHPGTPIVVFPHQSRGHGFAGQLAMGSTSSNSRHLGEFGKPLFGQIGRQLVET
jgi:hypothetical protein